MFFISISAKTIAIKWYFCISLLLPGISHDKGSEMSGTNIVDQNDLLIVGPGVLGRIVAEKWQKV